MISILKRDRRCGNDRRSGKDRRRYNDPDYKGLERRMAQERRIEIDRRK